MKNSDFQAIVVFQQVKEIISDLLDKVFIPDSPEEREFSGFRIRENDTGILYIHGKLINQDHIKVWMGIYQPAVRIGSLLMHQFLSHLWNAGILDLTDGFLEYSFMIRPIPLGPIRIRELTKKITELDLLASLLQRPSETLHFLERIGHSLPLPGATGTEGCCSTLWMLN